MSIFDWLGVKKKVDEVESTVPESSIQNDTTPSSKLSYDDILKNYSIERIQELTKIQGNLIISDLRTCDDSFRKNYFLEPCDKSVLEEEEQTLLEQKQNFESMGLKATVNYKEVRDKYDKLRKVINEQEILEEREVFLDNLVNYISKEIWFISFDDFNKLKETYGYGIIKSMDYYTGQLSEANLSLLQEIKEIDKDVAGYLYAIKSRQGNELKTVLRNREKSRLSEGLYRFKSIGEGEIIHSRLAGTSDHVKYTKKMSPISESEVASYRIYKNRTANDFLLLPIRPEYYDDMTRNKGNYFQTVVFKSSQVVQHPLFKEHYDIFQKTLEEAKQKEHFLCDEIYVEVEDIVLSDDVCLFVESSDPNNKPLIFQTWCDGVIVYGFLE